MKKIYTGLVCCCVLLSIQSLSQTWNGSANSDWNNAANWTPNNVPTASGNVIINNASATYQPALTSNAGIRTLNMSAGILNLNGYTLTCSVSATFTGDSLYNGKISSATLNELANMHMGGKIVLDKTGVSNEFWSGNNKFYGDSLIINWVLGGLNLENVPLSPDSIFGNLKITMADNYSVSPARNAVLYVKKNFVLDNIGDGTFTWLNSNSSTVVDGNLVGQNFSTLTPNLVLSNITTLGSNANGPFYGHIASINNCSFNGDFSLVADSNATINIHNSSFLGANNLLQAGSVDAYGNRFGTAGVGSTILRAAHNLTYNVFMRTGNNKFIGNAQWETFATTPGGLTFQHNWYGPDTCLQNLNFILKGNSALFTNSGGNNYVAGNLIIDGQGAMKFIEFTGGTGNSFNVAGSFTVKNLTPYPETGVGLSNIYLRNLNVAGTDTCGTFYCYTGDINNCSFNGNFKIIGDSSQTYHIYNSSLLGSSNLLQSGSLDFHDNRFGKNGTGLSIFRAAHNVTFNVFMRDGNNKFFGDANFETYAASPGGLTIQQTFYGVDSCFGNLNFILKGNAALTTNGNGHNYVAGNVIIDAQGKRKWIEFTGGAGADFTVNGNFTSKNFTPLYEPGVGYTDVYLRNLNVAGADTMGTFYCRTGTIQYSRFNGDLKLIADSNQYYNIYYSSLLGANNFIQSGSLDFHDNQFGKAGTGTTVLKGAYNDAFTPYMRDGNNKFLRNVDIETYALYPGSITIQQTFYGADTCLGDMNFILKGNSVLTTNGNGHNYVAGNVTIDGQGARKWVQFTGGSDVSFNVSGNFTAKNFTPFSEPGAGPTNVYLHNVSVTGSDTCGTFYCLTGDINNSSFNGNFKLVGDSAYIYSVNNSLFRGVDNLFQSGSLDFQNNQFGQTGSGTTIMRAAYVGGGYPYMRDGNNKFFSNATWETYSPYPGGVTIQQNFYGADTCLGNMNFVLKGNSGLTTNGGGHNYVAGNLTIDGQGARKWVQFTGGTGNSFNIDGNFTIKNFTPYSVPGVGTTNVFLHNLYVTGTDTVGTIYCYTGDINSSSVKGNFKLIADSTQPYGLYNSSFAGAINYFQGGTLDINNNTFGQIGNGITTFNVSHNMGAPIAIRDGNNRFLHDIDWIAVAPSFGSIYFQQSFYGADTCLGTFTLDLNGPSSANLAGNNLYLGKGLYLQNSGSGTIVHDNVGSAIHFIGVDTANYSYSGIGSAPSLRNIEINRKGGLRLMSPLTYTGNLLFTRGIILSSVSNPLQIPNGAVVSSAWDSSYVDGPVTKTGNTAFSFPLGRNNVFAPLGITAPLVATDAFTAQYFNHLAHIDGYDSTQHDFSLNHLSRREYWTLNRASGTSQVNVALSWKEKRSGGVTSMADLRVAHWNGTTWKDEGNGGTTGGNTEGTILSLNAINSFSPFTLASIGTSNPLPVLFITFDVQLQQQRTVLIQWTTSAEIDNHHFEVQRSNDRFTWITLQTILPNSNGVYFCIDKNAANGINYYRIKQVDFNGSSLYTQVKMINIETDNVIFLWPNPVVNEMHLQLPFSKGIIDISDENGRIVFTKIVDSNNMLIPVWQLKAGSYFLRIKNEKDLYVREFVKM